MRDRLRKLILESEILCHTCGDDTDSYCAEALADYLLKNGVILAPMPMAEWLRNELTEYVYQRCMEEL